MKNPACSLHKEISQAVMETKKVSTHCSTIHSQTDNTYVLTHVKTNLEERIWDQLLVIHVYLCILTFIYFHLPFPHHKTQFPLLISSQIFM